MTRLKSEIKGFVLTDKSAAMIREEEEEKNKKKQKKQEYIF